MVRHVNVKGACWSVIDEHFWEYMQDCQIKTWMQKNPGKVVKVKVMRGDMTYEVLDEPDAPYFRDGRCYGKMFFRKPTIFEIASLI